MSMLPAHRADGITADSKSCFFIIQNVSFQMIISGLWLLHKQMAAEASAARPDSWERRRRRRRGGHWVGPSHSWSNPHQPEHYRVLHTAPTWHWRAEESTVGTEFEGKGAENKFEERNKGWRKERKQLKKRGEREDKEEKKSSEAKRRNQIHEGNKMMRTEEEGCRWMKEKQTEEMIGGER